MKKHIIITLAAVVGILALAGCNNDSGIGMDVDAGSITIQATIGQMTKVVYNGNASSFTEDDTILLYGWTGNKASVPAERVVDSVTNWFDGTVWIPDKQMRWKNATDAHYFLGIYPVPDSMTSFTAATYKLNVSDYRASDLLVAANLGGIKATDGPVNLTFNHLMAKLNVNLKFASEWDSVPVVDKVTATVKTKATVNYLTGTMTANGVEEALAMPQSAITAAGYDYTYSCLEIPQADAKYITITVGARKFVYEASKNIPLNSGKLTTIDLKVGKDTILLNTISVSEWEAASDLPGGVAKLLITNGHEYVDMGNGLKWATCNVGAENPWDYGDYFDWGATAPYYQKGYSQESPCTHWIDGKDGYNWKNYSFMEYGQSDSAHITKYTFADGQTFGIWYDGDTFKGDNGDGVEHMDFASYDYADDAARANWGGDWRTPTGTEWTWLRDNNNCIWAWQADYNGVKGMLVTSKINGNQIFLPAAGSFFHNSLNDTGSAGFYWSSSLDDDFSDLAMFVFFTSGGAYGQSIVRFFGHSIRPVAN